MSTQGTDFPIVRAESAHDLEGAMRHLDGAKVIAFDCEGIDLGRYGSLTTMALKRMDGVMDPHNEPAVVIDVLAIGHAIVFSQKYSIKQLLESSDVVKITFDCRADSDALRHQFNVHLHHVVDLQVLDQAVRIHRGENPPQRRGTFLPFIKAMRDVAPRYLPLPLIVKIRGGPLAPHKDDPGVWGRRPLPDLAWVYAAGDVHLIDLVLRRMVEPELSAALFYGAMCHSSRYVDHFRSRQNAIRHRDDKNVIMEEVSIFVKYEAHPEILSLNLEILRTALKGATPGDVDDNGDNKAG